MTTIINISSGYGGLSRDPFVQICVSGENEIEAFCISPQQAREVALSLLECAESAEHDAFLFEYIEKNIGADAAPLMLLELRKWREG